MERPGVSAVEADEEASPSHRPDAHCFGASAFPGFGLSSMKLVPYGGASDAPEATWTRVLRSSRAIQPNSPRSKSKVTCRNWIVGQESVERVDRHIPR